MGRKHNSFTSQFKGETALLVLGQDYRVIEPCLAMEVVGSTLRRWIDQLNTDRQGITPKEHAVIPEQQRIQTLEKQVKRLSGGGVGPLCTPGNCLCHLRSCRCTTDLCGVRNGLVTGWATWRGDVSLRRGCQYTALASATQASLKRRSPLVVSIGILQPGRLYQFNDGLQSAQQLISVSGNTWLLQSREFNLVRLNPRVFARIKSKDSVWCFWVWFCSARMMG